jgi:2-polyprenyl-3-methyl-5-hydroxy-6-metoxy-1,4-benzoquinol methylase
MPPSSEFDGRATTWDSDPAKVERARRVAEDIVRQVPDIGLRRVLDYGAGTGLLGFELLPRAAAVTFADVSTGMLSVVEEKILRDRAANARAVVLDLTRGAPQSGAFDLVCTLMTMHHVPDPEGLLEAFRGVLAPGGILCVADLDVEDGSFHGPGFTGHRGFARGDLAARMRAAGFVAVRFSTPYEIRRDIGGVTKTYPLFLAVAVRPP